eukprot:scaffold9222_cov131-Isochrysis_galbana.AAC.1
MEKSRFGEIAYVVTDFAKPQRWSCAVAQCAVWGVLGRSAWGVLGRSVGGARAQCGGAVWGVLGQPGRLPCSHRVQVAVQPVRAGQRAAASRPP